MVCFNFFLCLSFTYINALFFCGRHSFSRCLLPPHSHTSQRDHLFTAAHSLLGLCGSNVGALPHLPHPVPRSQELLVLLVLLQCGLPSFSVFSLLFCLEMLFVAGPGQITMLRILVSTNIFTVLFSYFKKLITEKKNVEYVKKLLET